MHISNETQNYTCGLLSFYCFVKVGEDQMKPSIECRKLKILCLKQENYSSPQLENTGLKKAVPHDTD